MPQVDSLRITPEVLVLIAELDEFKGAWRAVGRLAPDRLSRLRKVATIESVGSSTRIEGSKLSDKEVETLLGRVGTESFATRDEQEVGGYAEVMGAIFQNYESIPITENYIRQLHSMLLRHSTKDVRHRGEYKKLANQIEAFDAMGKSVGIIFETTSPFETPREMHELVEWWKRTTEEKSTHPLLATAIFVVVFLAIHPFQDGNGRLSRILSTLLLMKAGYAYVPYSSLESIVEQNKDHYYLALRRTQGTLKQKEPDWLSWILFFLQALQKQKRALEAKVDREHILQAAMPMLAQTILELAGAHGEISVAALLQLTGAPRATIKKYLAQLVKDGHLQRLGEGRASRYVTASGSVRPKQP